jgi:integrase
MADSIGNSASCNPEKPYDSFPLFPHKGTSRWCKKIKGRSFYFGKLSDGWQAALDRYEYEIPYILRGQTPPPRDQQALDIDHLVNGYLEHQENRVLTGELTQRSWNDLKRVGELLIKHLGRRTSIEGLRPSDFDKLRLKLAEGKTLVTLNNEVGRCRCFFNYAFKAELIDRPVRMGVSFSKPTKKALRKEKQSKPAKIFTLDELQTIYQAAGHQMRCFILLALNGALGPSDIGHMESRHIVNGWVDYPRPKSTVERRFPLWKETIQAIEKTRQRKQPDNPLVFLTKYGQAWSKDTSDTPISKEFAKLLDELDQQAASQAVERKEKPPSHKFKIKGRGFYSLRHQFRTIADGQRDQVAIAHIMGHTDSTMGGVYREHIDDARLQAVTDFVFKWIKPMFRKPTTKGGAK